MELFQQLGAEIEALWLAKNYDEPQLPAIAADALRRFRLPSKLSAWDVAEWGMTEAELPRQRDLNGNFGDPPITIYSGPRFHIDVYFWFSGTTAIHQHAFCGAFQVLLGSSIHSWYEFALQETVNAFCEIGDIKLKVCEILEIGAVQEIRAGKQYIHSLFHLDQPSATIVVRTDRSPLFMPQLSYHKPNLAVAPFFEQETTTKKMQIMAALIRAKHPDADSLISDYLSSSDLHTSFILLNRLYGLLEANRLEQLFKLEAPRSRFDAFLDVVRKRHGALGDIFGPVFEQVKMLDEIVSRRGYLSDAEHRFFMALLLNVAGRERIFDLVTRRFAGIDPVEKVLDWIFDLSQTRIVGTENTNALGIGDFGEPEMFVVEQMLRGAADNEIAEAFAAENPGADPAAADAAIAKIRGSVIFRPLLTP